MTYTIHGDFTLYKEIEAGKEVKLKFDGFEELVKVIELSKDKVIIEVDDEVGKKLKLFEV